MFSPLPAGDGGTVGIIPYIGQSVLGGDLSNIFFRFNHLHEVYLDSANYGGRFADTSIMCRE